MRAASPANPEESVHVSDAHCDRKASGAPLHPSGRLLPLPRNAKCVPDSLRSISGLPVLWFCRSRQPSVSQLGFKHTGMTNAAERTLTCEVTNKARITL